MSFTGNEGQQITLEEGAEYTARHRDSDSSGIKGVFFGKSHIEKILAQGDCQGIRFYFAKKADGSPTLVMVGADANENDLLNVIVQLAKPCPTSCSTSNPLNTGSQGGSK